MAILHSRDGHCRLRNVSIYALLLVTALLLVGKCRAGWSQASATFFPAIDQGSCGYGKPDKLPTGRFIAAVSDKVPGYKDMCGKCFQIQCDKRVVTDLFGGKYWGAPNACRQKGKTIVVMVTDECTCIGNSKWCCDKNLSHLDLSEEAFSALANKAISGVMALNIQPVACPGSSSSANARKRVPAKAAGPSKCSKMVGPWQQCGGMSNPDNRLKIDRPWPGHCCKTFLKCQRSSKYYWSCKR